MTEKKFDTFLPHINKYETEVGNYLIEPENRNPDEEPTSLLAYREPCVVVKEPSVSLWHFLEKGDLEKFLVIEKKCEIRKFIASSIGRINPKGKARTVFTELMYNVTKFCKHCNFNVEQCGAVLSMFYLTHTFFTSKFDISAEKLYIYFKDLALCHSLPFPNNIKIFSLKETKEIMDQFCRLYLRNLPLIRFLCLPNFAFYMSYELEPEPKKEKKKKK